MQYFTRELYEAQQGDPDLAKVKKAEKEWNLSVKKYNEHLRSIKSILSKNMQAFSELNLHDAVIKSVSKTNNDILIKIDCSETDMEVESLDLQLKGVKLAEGLEGIEGEWWLYEELHISEQGEFELNVLLYHSEIHIIVDDIEVKKNREFRGQCAKQSEVDKLVKGEKVRKKNPT